MNRVRYYISFLLIFSFVLIGQGCGRYSKINVQNNNTSQEYSNQEDENHLLSPSQNSIDDEDSDSKSEDEASDPEGEEKKPEGTVTPKPPESTPNPDKGTKTMWLISVQQKINYTLLGTGELPCEDTLNFVAVNYNESPYDGEFQGYADLQMYINFKELYAQDTKVADIQAKQESKSFSFKLIPTGLASLNRDESVDPLLEDQSEASFLMQTSGDMFESFFVIDQDGATLSHKPQMDAEWETTVKQLNDEITIEIGMFGTFKGTIEHLDISESDLPPELVPLVP